MEWAFYILWIKSAFVVNKTPIFIAFIIAFAFLKKQILRYSELKRSLETITYKMLSTQLKELEADNLIIRKEYPQVPPKVEYSLSERWLTIMPVLQCLCEWGNNHIDD